MKPKSREYTEAEVRALVLGLRDRAGGIRPLARELALSPAYVFDVLQGRRPGPDFLRAVGVRKEVIVRYVNA